MRTTSRGLTMGTVLLVTATLLALALTLASTSTFHLQLATSQANREQGLNLAESAITEMVDILVDDPQHGQAENQPNSGITTTFGDNGQGQVSSGNNGQGRITFDPAQAASWDIPVSVNNLEQDGTVLMSDGRVVAPYTAYLVAVGSVNGAETTVESLVSTPPFRYSIASSGTVQSSGGLYVAGIQEFTDVSAGFTGIPPDQIVPGHLLANGSGESNLGSSTGASTITGDANSGGILSLGTQTEVQGAINQNAEQESLPEITLADYDNTGWVGLNEISVDTPFTSRLSLDGPVRRQGDLVVSNGGLELNGAYLFVDGNLTVNGGLMGRGVVFCTGDVEVHGASAVSTENVHALIAEGDIELEGYGRDTSYYHGIVHGQSNVDVSEITVIGSLIQNSNDASAELTVDNVNFLHLPSGFEFEFEFPFPRGAAVGNLFAFSFAGENSSIVPAENPELSIYYNETTDSFDSNLVTQANLPIRIRLDMNHAPIGHPPRFLTWQEGIDALNSNADPAELAGLTAELEANRVAYLAEFRNGVDNLNDLYQQARQSSMMRGNITFNPNQFIQLAGKARVLWTREID